MCPTRVHFVNRLDSRKANFRFRGLRESAEMCPTRTHFGFKMMRSFILMNTQNELSNSDFRIFEILTKLKQNRCSNDAQFRQLCSIFEFFEISENQNFVSETKLIAVRGIVPSDFKKIFDFTTCSFTVKSQFLIRP